MTRDMVGILDPDGDLLNVSDCNSMVDAGMFDGPALWPTVDVAREVNDEVGGLAEGYCFVKVTVTVGERLT